MKVMIKGAGGMLNGPRVHTLLSLLHASYGIEEVVQSDSTGSDYHAGAWARLNKVPHSLCRGDELVLGPYKRKRERLACEAVDLLILFPGHERCGLVDMVPRARGSAIRILEVA